MKHIFLILMVVVLLKPLCSREIESIIENCKKEVEEINSLTFERTIIKYPTVSQADDAKFPCYRNIDENMSYVYKDDEGRIRKFLTMLNHVEFSGYNVHYFDTTGEVVYSYIYYQTYMSPHFYGYRYMSEGKQIFCDMDVYDEDKDTWERVNYSNRETLLTYCSSFDHILHADSVAPFCKSLYFKDDFLSENITEQVRFTAPEKGTKTIINNREAYILEKDKMNSEIILKPLFGEIVEILEKGKEKRIKPFGKHNWYKVSVNDKQGYIFGAFLEPVEKTIE